MKRIVSLIIVLAICLSLCACGNIGKYAKYETLINCLENGDYAGAYAEISKISAGSETTEAPNETTTIEITLDNWQEYFEITLHAETEKNSFDEVTGFYPRYKFSLKEKYANTIEGIDLAVEYHATDGYFTEYTYDIATGAITTGEPDKDDPADDKTDTFSLSTSNGYYFIVGTPTTDTKPTIQTWQFISLTSWYPDSLSINGNIATIKASLYSTVDIVRIQGTITLLAE